MSTKTKTSWLQNSPVLKRVTVASIAAIALGLITIFLRATASVDRLPEQAQQLLGCQQLVRQGNSHAKFEPERSVSSQNTVTCLGHLEPMGELIKLTADSSSPETVVNQLNCEEGDDIKEGEVLAVLSNENRLKAGIRQAAGSVALAKSKLAIVKAGAKHGQIEAQRSEVKRLELQLHAKLQAQQAVINRLETAFRQASIDYKRYEFLHREKAVSSFDFDQKKLAMEVAQQELTQGRAEFEELQSSQSAAIESARSTLESIAEVRQIDIDMARSELEQAEGSLAQAQAALEQAYIRAPLTGKVLKIYARPGEKISEQGFAEVGRTQAMFAMVEVYQSDISKIKLGQAVNIEADSLPGEPLSGTVKRIGQEVRRQNVINSDPTANIDERVVEVRVQLQADASAKVKHLSNCQVSASIKI